MKLPKFNEEAVSPVIGVILMVAIVVILAAVVWVAVAPMADENLQSTKIVKVTGTYDKQGDSVEYLLVGGSGVGALSFINASVAGADEETLFDTANLTVGSLQTLLNVSKDDRVIVIGYFNDGTTQIIDDKVFK